MSVINQMLKDLDERQAAADQVGLPNEVRPLPPSSAGRGRRAGVVALLVAGAGAAGYWYWSTASETGVRSPVQMPMAAVPAPAVTAPSAAAAEPAHPAAAAALPVAPGAENDEISLQLTHSLVVLPKEDKRPLASASTPPRNMEPLPAAAPATQERNVPRVDARPKLASEASAGSVPKTGTGPGETATGSVSIDKQPRLGSARERADWEYRKGVSALGLARQQEAQAALRQALKEDATHVAARQLLLKLLVEQRALDEARQLLAEGLALQPRQTGWSMALARLQLDAGDPKAAWQTLESAMASAGDQSDFHGLAGGVLQRLQRYREAAEQYRLAAQQSPTDGRWWLGLGLALEAEGNGAEARQAFLNARAAAGLSPDMRNFVEQKLR